MGSTQNPRAGGCRLGGKANSTDNIEPTLNPFEAFSEAIHSGLDVGNGFGIGGLVATK